MNGDGVRGARAWAAPAVLGAAILIAETVVYARVTQFYGTGAYYLLSLSRQTTESYFREFVIQGSYYPPFYYVFLWIVHRFAGLSFLPFIAAGLLFPLGGMAYALAWGRRLGAPAAGGVAALLIALLPGTAIFSKTMIIEVPLLLFVPASLYHVAASRGFADRRHAALAGLMAGLGLLTKWTFPAYVASAMLVALVPGLLGEAGDRARIGRRLAGLAIAIGIGVAVAGPWYLTAFNVETFRKTAMNDPTLPVYSLAGQLARNLANFRMVGGRWTLPVVLAATVLLAAFHRRTIAAIAWLAAVVAVPLAILSLPAHIEDRYVWPAVPLLAMALPIAVSGKARRGATTVRAAVLLALVAVGTRDHLAAVVPPRGGVYEQADQILYVNHDRGRLFWGRMQTGKIFDRMLAHLDQAGEQDSKPALLVTHPLWENYHCAYTYLELFRRMDPRRSRIRVQGLTTFQYATFHELLLARAPEFILINCGVTGDCRDRVPELDLPRTRAVLETPYVDQFSGRTSRTFAAKDVAGDLDVLAANYVLLESFGFDRQGRVNLYARRP